MAKPATNLGPRSFSTVSALVGEGLFFHKDFQIRLCLDGAPSSISARTLCFVEELVGPFIEFLKTFIAEGIRHSHAGGYRSLETRNGTGDNSRNCLSPAFGQGGGIIAAQEKYKFFTAKTVCPHVRPCLESIGYSFEHGISNGMSVYVID